MQEGWKQIDDSGSEEAAPAKTPSPTMLYVSNLPFSVDDEELTRIFAEYNPTTCYVAVRRGGRSKGFAFVNFADTAARDAALNGMDGREVEGRNISVSVAHKDERRNSRGELKEEFKTAARARRGRQNRGGAADANSGGGAEQGVPSETVLYVSNLPFSFSDEDLGALFADYNFVSARVARRRNARSKGFGFVEFADHEAQQAALAVDGVETEDGRVIGVKVSNSSRVMADEKSKEPSEDTLYVSNVPFSMEDEELAGVFADYDVTSARVARRRNGRSKGFGFVTLSSTEEQERALAVDGTEVEGRALVVNKALKEGQQRMQEQLANAGSNTGGGGGGRKKREPRAPRPKATEPSPTMLYVSNLPFTVDDDRLQQMFADFDVESAHVATRRNGRSKGFAFVNFTSHEEQQRALEACQGWEEEGRVLMVEVAKTRVEEQEAPATEADAAPAEDE